MDLIIGRQYTRYSFYIEPVFSKLAELVVAGELLTFFSMTGKYRNIIQDDGFVYEGRAKYSLIPPGIKTSLQRYVFVRKRAGEEYTYLGKGLYEARYDDTRNKIFFEVKANNTIDLLPMER